MVHFLANTLRNIPDGPPLTPLSLQNPFFVLSSHTGSRKGLIRMFAYP